MNVTSPDWRISCFFVDRDHKREGVAKAALGGALRIIAANGAGGLRISDRHSRGVVLRFVLVGWD